MGIWIGLILLVTPQSWIAQELSTLAARGHVEAEMTSLQITQGETCTPQHMAWASSLQGSGRYAVRWSGALCRGAAWVTVRVLQAALVLTKEVRAGEPLEGVLTRELREVRRSSRLLAELPPGAVSAVTLKVGAVLETHHIRDEGNQPGKDVNVWVKAGDVEVTQTGRIISCGTGRFCVRVPSGVRVEGKRVDGRVVVEVPR